MDKRIAMTWLVSLTITSAALAADPFDGSEPVLCALTDLQECVPAGGCEKVTAESINAPPFLRVNVADKQITGKRANGSENTAAIEFMERLDGKLILQGADDGVDGVRDGLGWTLAIAEDTGKLVLTASGDDWHSSHSGRAQHFEVDRQPARCDPGPALVARHHESSYAVNTLPVGSTAASTFFEREVAVGALKPDPMRRAMTSLALITALTMLAGGCSTPVRVERVDPRVVHQELTSNAISTGTPSGSTQIVLRQTDLLERMESEPKEALAALHAAVVDGDRESNAIFALAELSFLHALETGEQSHYRAAAVYAYAYLFPGAAGDPPDPFDPRLRIAANIYNRSLTEGLDTHDGSEVALRAGRYALPFGTLDVAFDPAMLHWGNRRLANFEPVAELEVHGLRNRYRQAGVGAPLAAEAIPDGTGEASWDFVARRAKVPITVFLRVEGPRRQLREGRLRASLELYVDTDADTVKVDGREIPLEVEPSAALASQLSSSRVWEWEFSGFLLGELLSEEPTQLIALEPYRSGRIPVVFVHGTASSPARWADMFNDLRSDPQIREQFQFWFFAYDSGNPIPHSAMLLRDALREAVEQLDPEAADPSLRQMVVIGHSQGGLLTKMTAIDTGSQLWDKMSSKPIDKLRLSEETRELARRMLFVQRLPFVSRVVFIATPHRGSYLAGNWFSDQIAELVKLPGNILSATTELVTLNPDAIRSAGGRIGSVYGMTPGSPFSNALASIPIAPGVAAHSIVAVKGDGPPEEGGDGVVRYSSAHLDDADSELVVRSGHSAQSNPHTIDEVLRILRLHASELCAGGVGCVRPAR